MWLAFVCLNSVPRRIWKSGLWNERWSNRSPPMATLSQLWRRNWRNSFRIHFSVCQSTPTPMIGNSSNQRQSFLDSSHTPRILSNWRLLQMRIHAVDHLSILVSPYHLPPHSAEYSTSHTNTAAFDQTVIGHTQTEFSVQGGFINKAFALAFTELKLTAYRYVTNPFLVALISESIYGYCQDSRKVWEFICLENVPHECTPSFWVGCWTSPRFAKMLCSSRLLLDPHR